MNQTPAASIKGNISLLTKIIKLIILAIKKTP